MALPKYTNTDGYNSKVANGQLPDAQFVKAINPPFGTITAWHKTFSALTSGSSDTNTTDKLVDSSATFITDGVVSGMIVRNTSNNSFAIVDTVESETSILLKADTQAGSTNADIFPSGTGNYTIYNQRELPGAWLELNGQTIDDSDSPFDGETLPDLNGENRFLRGEDLSGSTGGSSSHTHTGQTLGPTGGSNSYGIGSGAYSGHRHNFTTESSSNIPPYFEVVWIMRCK